MKLISIISLSLFLHSSFAGSAFYLPYIDSSEESTILFGSMKAVSSSKIVHFSWDVEAEQYGDYFVIEKSIDNGETWSQVTRVESLGNHNETHTYSISEINMVEGVRELFRVTRVDKDGVSKTLDQVDITHPILSNMKLIPDPKNANSAVTITCESMINAKGTMQVFNEAGELVLSQSMDMVNGYNRTELSTKKLKPGEYRVVVQNEFTDKLAKRLVVH